ncbi:MAG: flagellar basal body L-ring protein FlgH [Opitutales bacterium]|jgi:flagellar L-ring protein FlgH|nr:flagellar basal body L-ring protein FlgH [Opitutales bacterium]MBT5168825.1 flagellar basal body L-ring protein FlgH [Opitutales bacterium]MBT5813598.1 flagellar basal body L-ring protein FlgH [Opitutales bacterium]MBT6768155.1 flagellar basal body L-ring protein FlgH [Opitutales bacterium]MDG2254000.1 flagellar basal body L-ring protein FlgH [Opitutaceae bacterium]
MKALLISLGMTVLAISVVTGESLWLSKSTRETSLFADRTAAVVGDILTVMIDESTIVSATASKLTNSGSTLSGGTIGSFFGVDIGRGLTEGIIATPLNSTSNGTGNVSSIRSAVSTASVLVIDRLPNGNLIIEGAREQVVSGETQYVVVRGVVRRDDIASDNTVMSSKIANAKVEFLDKGAIASAQKQGWIAKLLDVANVW